MLPNIQFVQGKEQGGSQARRKSRFVLQPKKICQFKEDPHAATEIYYRY